MTLQSIAGDDPESSYDGLWGLTPAEDDLVIPPRPTTVPDYLSALDLNFVQGKRIGYNGTFDRRARRPKLAFDALEAAGAIMVRAAADRRRRPCPRLPGGYQQHKAINGYYSEPRPGRADQDARRGDRRQPGQRARGAEVRQQHARRTRSRPTSAPGGGRTSRLPRRPCRSGKRLSRRGDRPDDEQRHARRSERRLHRDPRHRAERRRAPATRRSRSRWATTRPSGGR